MSTQTSRTVKRLYREYLRSAPKAWRRLSLRAFARSCPEPQAALWLARKADR